jgi:hypothetical protein
MYNKCIQISKEGLRLVLTGRMMKVGNPKRILEFAVNISSAMRNQIIPIIQHFFLQYFLRLVQFDLCKYIPTCSICFNNFFGFS